MDLFAHLSNSNLLFFVAYVSLSLKTQELKNEKGKKKPSKFF